MKMDIDLKIIKPTNELRLACFGNDNILRTIKYGTTYGFDGLLTLLGQINNDWNQIINITFDYRDLIDKLVLNQKLTIEQKKTLVSLKKIIKTKSNKQIETELYNLLLDYKTKVAKNIFIELSKLYTPTNANLSLFGVNTRIGFGGSATKYSFYISTNNLNSIPKHKEHIFALITHELIHTINSNNCVYKNIRPKLKNQFSNNYFSETFTDTITNIVMYKAGYSKEKYPNYRYPENKNSCELEDKLRLLYDSWNKSTKKEKFIEFIYKRADKL